MQSCGLAKTWTVYAYRFYILYGCFLFVVPRDRYGPPRIEVASRVEYTCIVSSVFFPKPFALEFLIRDNKPPTLVVLPKMTASFSFLKLFLF